MTEAADQLTELKTRRAAAITAANQLSAEIQRLEIHYCANDTQRDEINRKILQLRKQIWIGNDGIMYHSDWNSLDYYNHGKLTAAAGDSEMLD